MNYQMRIFLKTLFVVFMMIVLLTGGQVCNVLQASSVYAAALRERNDDIKGGVDEFAFEMAQITAGIVTANTDVETFKFMFAGAVAKVTARIMPMMSDGRNNQFAYEMAQFTTKVMNDPNLDIEGTKAEFSYKMAQLTTEVMNSSKQSAGGSTRLKSNVQYEEENLVGNRPEAGKMQRKERRPQVNTQTSIQSSIGETPYNSVKVYKSVGNDRQISRQSTNVTSGAIDSKTYNTLMDELLYVEDTISSSEDKWNVDGEVRIHYAANSGSERLDKDLSGIRARVAFEREIDQNWRVHGAVEGKKNLLNYDNELKLERLYVAGNVGQTAVKAGAFGYLMAEGNIYDSRFDGLRVDFGDDIQYTISYGNTNESKHTSVFTARYEDFDYDVEAGIYHYTSDQGDERKNTIWTVGGNYHFSNFSVGAMHLQSNRKDDEKNSSGYVASIQYGDVKTWRPGTYEVFAKYYNQPQTTYIAHGMNGMSQWLHGFKGYGVGVGYTVTQNVVAGLEYYNLTDKMTKENGETWWMQITRYF